MLIGDISLKDVNNERFEKSTSAQWERLFKTLIVEMTKDKIMTSKKLNHNTKVSEAESIQCDSNTDTNVIASHSQTESKTAMQEALAMDNVTTCQLFGLAQTINVLQEELQSQLQNTVKRAAVIGGKLNQVKRLLPHGAFGEWLKINCTISQQQANKYMKLANDSPEMLDSNYSLTSNLSIESAYLLLSAPETVKEEVQNKLVAGEIVSQQEIQELKRKNKELTEQLSKQPEIDVAVYKTTIDDLTQQIKKQKQTIAQSKSKVDFHETRIKELEQNLVDATNEEAKNVAMEALKAEALAGKNKEIVALDERIRQETEALRKLESLESVLAERYNLNPASHKTGPIFPIFFRPKFF